MYNEPTDENRRFAALGGKEVVEVGASFSSSSSSPPPRPPSITGRNCGYKNQESSIENGNAFARPQYEAKFPVNTMKPYEDPFLVGKRIARCYKNQETSDSNLEPLEQPAHVRRQYRGAESDPTVWGTNAAYEVPCEQRTPIRRRYQGRESEQSAWGKTPWVVY